MSSEYQHTHGMNEFAINDLFHIRRQFEKNHAKIALEKDRIRKDYYSMSKDLRNILNDESLSKHGSQVKKSVCTMKCI